MLAACLVDKLVFQQSHQTYKWMFSKMLVAKATKLAHVSTKGLIMYTTSIYIHIYECHVVTALKASKGTVPYISIILCTALVSEPSPK